MNLPSLIIPAIGEAMGFTAYGMNDPKTHALNDLHTKHLLLVLDNMEHLLNGARFVTEILESAPYVKILCTSREPLNLRGEWVFEVRGLPIPQANHFMEAEPDSNEH